VDAGLCSLVQALEMWVDAGLCSLKIWVRAALCSLEIWVDVDFMQPLIRFFSVSLLWAVIGKKLVKNYNYS
jgi:hypothetical protein